MNRLGLRLFRAERLDSCGGGIGLYASPCTINQPRLPDHWVQSQMKCSVWLLSGRGLAPELRWKPFGCLPHELRANAWVLRYSLVFGGVAMHQVLERLGKVARNRPRYSRTNHTAVDLGHGNHLCRGACQQYFIGGVEIVSGQVHFL